MSRTWVRLGAAAVFAVLYFPQLAYRLGADAASGDIVPSGASCVVFVLGFPSRSDGGPSGMQKLRMAAGVGAYRRFACSKMVISGGAVHTPFVEAEKMAELAREAGVPQEALALESTARNTWENVGRSLPLLAGFDKIVVVSDGLHVHRGKRYLCRQAPDLCPKVVRASGDALTPFWIKIPGAAHEAAVRFRDRF